MTTHGFQPIGCRVGQELKCIFPHFFLYGSMRYILYNARRESGICVFYCKKHVLKYHAGQVQCSLKQRGRQEPIVTCTLIHSKIMIEGKRHMINTVNTLISVSFLVSRNDDIVCLRHWNYWLRKLPQVSLFITVTTPGLKQKFLSDTF